MEDPQSGGTETAETGGLQIDRRFTKDLPDCSSNVYHSATWEKRDAVITGEDGRVVFEQKGVDFPASWSQLATNVVASKYFRGPLDSDKRETSLWDIIDRVVGQITDWGELDGYFDSREAAEAFSDELSYILLHQKASFNSPVWFNIGVDGATPQASACFIISCDDHMEDILEWYRQEGVIFKGGSGSGVNLSRLRAEGEPLLGGGEASGPLSFMKAADASAGAIKSGGTCLPYHQKVYTENGPVEVGKLAELPEFIALSYDPPASRFKAKRAQAWLSGRKPIVRVTTDKGAFDLSHDHPVRLSTGDFVQAGKLTPGMSLHKCTVSIQSGYLRVNLNNGRKGKRQLHRLVAEDVMGIDREMPVHHRDEDKLHNSPDNLKPMPQSEHAHLHSMEQVEAGVHTFQTHKFPKHGAMNPMHRDSDFWRDPEKVAKLSAHKAAAIKPKAKGLQEVAATQRMINLAQRILNDGGSIDTIDDYFVSRTKIVGKIADKRKVARSINNRFGSYDGFLAAVNESNHRVVSVERIGSEPVYSVEVACPTLDDKTPQSGHNYVIWPHDGDYGGSGIVVSNTRRSAKMVVLDVDHPDIKGFIDCKVLEEKKAHALIAAGYDPSLDGEAYGTVSYQNANNSVRVSDAFMHAAENGKYWRLTYRTSGELADEVPARDLLRKIAEATWECGDPGIQFDDTINAWHTCPEAGRQEATNPCSEYCWINDSACNLASINLMAFLDEDGAFDSEEFSHVVSVMILAQEILVGHASYPTEAIERNNHAFRTLGLGYANLGAMLMALGHPYDSDDGRKIAAYVTAVMTGQAYLTSARIAKHMGPFEGHRDSAQSMMHVILRHRDATRHIAPTPTSQDYLTGLWKSVVREGIEHGFRNAQVTLLAPTGTIAFMMDCDTTGIEPELALVKHKKLVGGGSLRIVNQTVKRALEGLEYLPHQIEHIVNHIDMHGTVEGDADVLPAEHLPIFDCSFPATEGGRFIDYRGHLRMVAAVQPFLSGAVSKTINVPNDATVPDIEQAYIDAWRMGIKCVAIYRDGSKRTQPLSTMVKNAVETLPKSTVRRRLPDERESRTHKFTIAGHDGYITVGLYADGTPGEIFLVMSKQGSTVSGLTDAFATSISMALQYGVPLRALIAKFSHMRFEPAGFTNNDEIPMAKSLMDYIFRWLASRFLPKEDHDEIGIIDRGDTVEAVVPNGSVNGHRPHNRRLQEDAPPCTECGSIMFRNGTCYQCSNCGITSGCS